MIFRISVAAELGRPALAETALEQHRHPKIANLAVGLGIPSMLKLHWLKSTFADKFASVISAKVCEELRRA